MKAEGRQVPIYMRVQFVIKPGVLPARLVCDAEVLFDAGCEFAGMKLVGFSVWKGNAGKFYVTFPAKPTGDRPDRKYFDFLRAVDGGGATIGRVKAWILAEYEASLKHPEAS